ncbi:DUF1702 family protein [Actinosynnema pretiosum subsp. pretiosum]|uniref:DUF1702 family protein n=1 Tax=Actinosynnema pretiosum subsp. pretiosum TaxID=103721 RepID=A0AA45L7I9_9PSEU|nr:UnbL [Actinosynnema pretiosum subsp. pretiosum]QUF04508.1 DUF1702 family protein [Actinosynnema pretiosum subsp. pretiosum]
MSSTLGALRRRVLTPDVSETRLSVRGFHDKDPAARELLETVGGSFLAGFGHAAQARAPEDATAPLDGIPAPYRGFAYEGAGMAFAIRDALPLGRRGRNARFLSGAGAPHAYMVHVGAGWAMARVPRALWSRLALDDPLLRWLALDGYGFHQAYFHTERYVRERYREARFPWPGGPLSWYADHVIDQGIGRASWFVGGADPTVVADLIDSFAESRRGDLYAGAGLAATYAGGGDEAELREFAARAGDWAPQLAQGSAFAATARVDAGLEVPHTSVATGVFCGITPREAKELCDRTRPGPVAELPERPGVPAYEVWRQRIASAFGAGVSA